MNYLALIMLSIYLPAAIAADPGDPVYINPRVWNYGNSASVDVWNTSDVDIQCNGTIYLSTRSGRTQTEFYWETIYAGFSNNQTYRLWDYQDRITYVSHSIRCRER